MRLSIFLLSGLLLAAQDTAPRGHQPVMRLTIPSPILHSQVEMNIPIPPGELPVAGKVPSAGAKQPPAVCAIPLLRAEAEKSKTSYSMKFAPIQGDHSHSVITAQPPAPACDSKDYSNK